MNTTTLVSSKEKNTCVLAESRNWNPYRFLCGIEVWIKGKETQ